MSPTQTSPGSPAKSLRFCDFCHLATLERKQIWLQLLKSGESPILEALNYTLKIHQLFSGGPKKTSHNHLTRNKLLPASEELCSSAKTSRWKKKSKISWGLWTEGFFSSTKGRDTFFQKSCFSCFCSKTMPLPYLPVGYDSSEESGYQVRLPLQYKKKKGLGIR